ncbi:hypothetical protein FKM82_001146 [Ascaphus truei]
MRACIAAPRGKGKQRALQHNASGDSPQAALRARQAAGREAALPRKGARRVLQCKAAGEVQQPHAVRQPSVTVPRGRASQRPGRASAMMGRTSTAGTQVCGRAWVLAHVDACECMGARRCARV